MVSRNAEREEVKAASKQEPEATQPPQQHRQEPKVSKESTGTQTAGSENAGAKIIAAMQTNQNEEWTATRLTKETGLKLKTVAGPFVGFVMMMLGKTENRT
jgi:hypothetical protein